MKLWQKTSMTRTADGGSVIRYEAEGCPCAIESRKRAVPHANRSGSWMHTSYFLLRPDGTELEFWRLRDAQDAAEGV